VYYRGRAVSAVVILIAVVVFTVQAEDTKSSAASGKIPKGSKVFVAPITDGFDTYLKNAIVGKKVPVEVVESRDLAQFEITGISESQKASTAKKIILGNWHSREEASIRVSNIKSSEVVWSYSVHKEASAHGKKSTAEACAKHLKDEAIEK
jgi:hypothetical protein